MSTHVMSANKRTGVVITAAALGIIVLVVGLVRRAESDVNQVALASLPQPVSTVLATAATYRPTRAYVGTLEPWTAASIGPQFVAAYVDSVRVRPGATVHKGDVLATLDCRDVNSSTAAVAARARALDAQQQALANQVKRLDGLRDHGYVSADDVEQKSAQSLAESEQLTAEKAHLSSMSLQVADCVLRAPFDGEITGRFVDPGAFVRPGASIVALTDRHTVRFTADVPERDYAVVAEGKPVRIHVESVNLDLQGAVSRRIASADYATRTVHFEVDLANAEHALPVNVTGVAVLEVGEPIAATEIPIRAASVQNGKATVFVVTDGLAHAQLAPILGEREAALFVDKLAAGAVLVTEGRTLLADGDRVTAQPEPGAAK